MGFGFPPKHHSTFAVAEGHAGAFLTQAIMAAEQAGWEISSINQSGFIAHTKFSWSSWSEQIDLTIGEIDAKLVSKCTGTQLMDWGKNKKNIDKFSEQFFLLEHSYSKDYFFEKYNALRSSLPEKEPNDELAEPQKAGVSSFLALFIPRKDYYVTPILLNLNTFIFILMAVAGVGVFTPDGQSLVDWGANFRPSTMRGEWWRLLTACFLHIGLIHLLLNLYALLYIGIVLEPYLKRARFLAVYLSSGIVASACSLWWQDNTVSAGASGAIFGLYGVFFALLTTNILNESVKKSFLTSTAVFVIYNLLNGLKPDSGVDNAAHIGGLIAGLVMGYAVVPSLRNETQLKLKAVTIGTTLTAAIFTCFLFYKTIPNDYRVYDEQMTRFSEFEEKALTVFNLPQNTENPKLIKELTETGLPFWYKNLGVVETIDRLNLPLNLKTRNRQLKKYCELRIKHCQLLCKALTEDTDKYNNELIASNDAIGKAIADLSE